MPVKQSKRTNEITLRFHFKNPYNKHFLDENKIFYTKDIKENFFYIQKCIKFNDKQIKKMNQDKENKNYYFINENKRIRKLKCTNKKYFEIINDLWDDEIEVITDYNDYIKEYLNNYINKNIKKYFAIKKIQRWAKNIIDKIQFIGHIEDN